MWEEEMISSDHIALKVADKIRKSRKDSRLSQIDLGRKLGYSTATISKIEAGTRKIGIDELWQFAQVLDKPISFFLDNALLYNSQMDNQLTTLTEFRMVERVVIPIWDKLTETDDRRVLCYAYMNPARIKGRNIIGLQFRGIPLDIEIKNGDVIFFDTLAEPTAGKLVLALIKGILAIVRCIRKKDSLVFEYSGGLLYPNEICIRGPIVEVRKNFY
jgi:transcriptional regulator with XRE-family HTH domain